jgi:hypothetical protein
LGEARADTLVYHELDGDWQFICDGTAHGPGKGDDHAPESECVLIHPEHIFEFFPDVRPVNDLMPGQWAGRETPKSAWVRHTENNR